MTARSKAWVCGRSLVGFESRRRHGCLFPVSVVYCQVEVSAMGRSHIQRIPTAMYLSVIVKTRLGVWPIRVLRPGEGVVAWIP